MTLVVTLTVRAEALEAFRSFEAGAARVMAKHGGAIERTIVVPPAQPGAPTREVHVVTFPDERALRAYQADPELDALRPLREASVLATEILVGEDGPDYPAPAR